MNFNADPLDSDHERVRVKSLLRYKSWDVLNKHMLWVFPWKITWPATYVYTLVVVDFAPESRRPEIQYWVTVQERLVRSITDSKLPSWWSDSFASSPNHFTHSSLSRLTHQAEFRFSLVVFCWYFTASERCSSTPSALIRQIRIDRVWWRACLMRVRRHVGGLMNISVTVEMRTGKVQEAERDGRREGETWMGG